MPTTWRYEDVKQIEISHGVHRVLKTNRLFRYRKINERMTS